jgi:hypothetical protein
VAAADTPTPEPPTATSEPPTATLEPTATITPTPEPESGFDSPTLVLRYDWRRDWPAWVEQSLMVAEDTITAQTLTDTGLQDQWSQPVLAVEGLTPDRAALQFLSRQGVGRIAPDGAVTWDWQPPQDFGHWAYHGGTREVAYVQNQDVFSIAAAPDAQPVRWTQQGIARSVLRFADADTLLVRTSTETNLMVLHRDGSGYHIPISWTFIVAPDHTVLALESESGVFWKPGATELELIADLSDSQSIMHTQMPQYGWLPKKQVLLLHSLALQEDATSGIFAFDRQRTLRQVIPSLVAAPGLPGFGGTLTDRRGAYAFAESSNRMALVWREEGNAGTFIIDVDASTAQPVTTLTPDRLFWPRADGLLLVVNEGDQLGTWWQPVDGSPARQLFQYRVEQATSLPDGRLLLIANKTLWQQQGEDAPQMIGEEGSVDDTRRFLRLTAPTGE